MQQIYLLRKAIARLLLGAFILLHIGYAVHSAMHWDTAESSLVDTAHEHESISLGYTHCILCDLGLLPILTATFVPAHLSLTLVLIAIVFSERVSSTYEDTSLYTSLRAPPVF